MRCSCPKSVLAYSIFLVLVLTSYPASSHASLPMIITTWKFIPAAEKAWDLLYRQNSTTLDAIEQGCKVCEIQQCDFTVGFGGSPDEKGETTLEGLMMDGTTMNVGGVASVRRIKNVISLARKVMEHTAHSILAGDLATKFAVEMGFVEEPLSTPLSLNVWREWTERKCQPNFRLNVRPNPEKNCGPYTPIRSPFLKESVSREKYDFSNENHDTISMIAIDKQGNISAGTSTNGANHKVPGRVGDSPIPGAGAYADSSVGGAAATGDGDVMLRFLPSFVAVEEMRRGTSPAEAAAIAIQRVANKYPTFMGAVIAVNKLGVYGAACHGMESFPFVVANPTFGDIHLESVTCVDPFITKV